MYDDLYARFACPTDSLDELLRLIASETGGSVLQQALEDSSNQLAKNCPGLASHLRKWAEQPGSDFWHPAIGVMRSLLSHSESVPLELFLCLAFETHFAGMDGEWRFVTNTPVRIWGSHWALPWASGGEVKCIAGRVHISLAQPSSDPFTATFEHSRGDWVVTSCSDDSFTEFPVVLTEGPYRICIVSGDVAPDEMLPKYPGAAFLERSELEEFRESLARTLDFMRRYAPQYLKWIAPVVKFIAPVCSGKDLIGSSSTPAHSGLISVVNDKRELVIGELLVHEASHQVFFLATRIDVLIPQNERSSIYSRFARRERPLDRILLAYHALANIALFYEECIANGAPRNSCANRLAYITANMHELDETLREANKFTPLSYSLWSPLSSLTQGIGITMDKFASDPRLGKLYILPKLPEPLGS